MTAQRHPLVVAYAVVGAAWGVLNLLAVITILRFFSRGPGSFAHTIDALFLFDALFGVVAGVLALVGLRFRAAVWVSVAMVAVIRVLDLVLSEVEYHHYDVHFPIWASFKSDFTTAFQGGVWHLFGTWPFTTWIFVLVLGLLAAIFGSGVNVDPAVARQPAPAVARAASYPYQAAPPPPPAAPASDEPVWFTHIGGQVYGPYRIAELRAYLAEGRVTAAAPAWRDGVPPTTVAALL